MYTYCKHNKNLLQIIYIRVNLGVYIELEECSPFHPVYVHELSIAALGFTI